MKVPELHGVAAFGEAWMLVGPTYPVPSGQPVELRVRLSAATGVSLEVRVEGAGFEPPGAVVEVSPGDTPGWTRPGREWQVRVRFPRTGCFNVRTVAAGVDGSFTVRVK